MRKGMMAASVIAAALFSAAAAEAGILGKLTSSLSFEVIALVISALLALAAGALGIVFVRVARTFRETGEFLTALGCALDDRRITREELAGIVKEGKDIFGIWR
ncbi:MAG: hypothetical protein ACYC9O_19625 [Candidatus Latescibacterota bacterium]